MYKNEQTEKKRRRKYPGHRPCLNHDILFEMFKNPVPELCPKCFGSTAKNQVQLVALNYCSIQVLRQQLTKLFDELGTELERMADYIDEQEGS